MRRTHILPRPPHGTFHSYWCDIQGAALHHNPVQVVYIRTHTPTCYLSYCVWCGIKCSIHAKTCAHHVLKPATSHPKEKGRGKTLRFFFSSTLWQTAVLSILCRKLQQWKTEFCSLDMSNNRLWTSDFCSAIPAFWVFRMVLVLSWSFGQLTGLWFACK